MRRALTAAAVLGLSLPIVAAAQDTASTHGDSSRVSYVGVDYSYQNFNGQIAPWQLASLSLGTRTARGSLIARVNRAERFGSSGGQVEVDAYPHIAQGVYAYLNLGYSSASLFPEWRSGGEIFTSLPSAYEASIGYRQLRFDGVPVTLFTGAVGKYSGNYWFSLRPYVREKDNGLSASASLTTRRYFADGDHYLGARVGFGSTPSDQLYQDQVSRVSSFSAAVQGSGDLVRSLLATWSLGYDREEITRGLVRNSVSLSAGIRASF